MIDYSARQKLAEQTTQNKHTSELVSGLKDAIVTGLQSKAANGQTEDILKLVFKKEDDPQQSLVLKKIGEALAMIYNQVRKPLVLPKIFQIKGSVEVTKQSSVEIKNFKELERYFQSLEQKLTVWAQAASTAPQPKIEFPKFELPKNNTKIDLGEVTSAIQELQKVIQSREKSSDTAILRRMSESLDAFVSRPVMTPQPVTNITLNASEGYVKTTAATVGLTVTQLPAYGQLFNRRSLQVFNNSNNTIYLGGSDVTTANGIPVLGNSYSNVFDAGYNMIVYGIASQGGNNVRCIETSKDQSANVQE